MAIRCDARLREVFQADRLELARMAEALKPHLRPLDPVTLEFTIRRAMLRWACRAALGLLRCAGATGQGK